jgi:hypothetical protein
MTEKELESKLKKILDKEVSEPCLYLTKRQYKRFKELLKMPRFEHIKVYIVEKNEHSNFGG